MARCPQDRSPLSGYVRFTWAVITYVLLAVVTLATAQSQDAGGEAQASGTGEVIFFVFDGDAPVQGAELQVGGETIAETGADGGLVTNLPAGRHEVSLVRDGQQVLDLDLLTAEGERVQVVVGLQEQGEPDLSIESTGTQPVLAQDEEGESSRKAGLLEGTITAEDGGPVVDARVTVPSRGRAVRTNDKGLFQIELPPGNYSVKVSHPDFATQTVENLRVIPGKAVSANMSLAASGVQLADYVVTADYEEGSIASELSLQRESAQVVSVIGAEQMSRTGDSNAAEAVQRVSGLVVEQGKFVVIRGQPFRYTLTQFNGMPLPSPDPVLQTVPLDLFPESILANIQVQKSYSADQPGNFGGGLVGLNTVSTPSEPFLDVQVSTGGNDYSTGEDGLTYDGTDEDWIGGIGGQRKLPDAVPSETPLGGTFGDRNGEVGRSFNDLFLVEEDENLPADFGLEAAGGRSFPTEYGTFGFLATASYDQKYRRVKERDIDFQSGQGDSLEARTDFVERRTDREVQLSSLIGLSGDWENHSVASNTFFIRDTRDRTQISEGTDRTSQPRFEQRYLLEYNQRELLLSQLLGEHSFGDVQLNWEAQTAGTDRERPDRRDYSYQRPLGTDRPLRFFAEDGLERAYNTVEDDMDTLGADVSFPVELTGTEVSAGFDMNERDRSSETRRFLFTPAGTADLESDRIELIINDGTIERGGDDNVDFREDTFSTDSYEGTADTLGYFVNTDTRIGDYLRIALGVRQTEAEYEVVTAGGRSGGFDRSFTLPSLAVTGFLSDEMQVRGSVGKSVSYPLLVELSDTTFFNPDTGESFSGSPDLEPTEITSYDLRWEWYPSSVEALTAGVFYKDLTNAIETRFEVSPGQVARIMTNTPAADIVGAEIGGRAGLGWLADGAWLAQMYVSGNFTLIDSTAEAGEAGVATNSERPLAGQADSVLNLQLGYDGAYHDLTLTYNRVGERLEDFGTQGRPDIYLQPVDFLNATYSLRIPSELPFVGEIPYVGEGRIKIKGENLLGEELEYRQGDLLQRRIIYGRSFSASLKWNFF